MGWWEDEQINKLVAETKTAGRALTAKEARKLLAKHLWSLQRCCRELGIEKGEFGEEREERVGREAREPEEASMASLFRMSRATMAGLGVTALLQVASAQMEWGLVFFILAAFFWMIWSMRGGQRKPGELSAYSLLNPGCQALPGSYEESLKGFFDQFNFTKRHNPHD